MTDTHTNNEPTPQQRLETTRQQIVDHMFRDDTPERRQTRKMAALKAPVESAAQVYGYEAADVGTKASEPRYAQPAGNWALIKKAFASWWHHHPANVATDIATPFLSTYARSHPAQLLGIAAGVGAAAVVFKAWRLISVGGILLGVLKSADLSGVILTAMTRASKPSRGRIDHN